jgi:hypothetical protein
MPTLFKSDYATIEHAVASRVIRIVRSAKPFESSAHSRAEVVRWRAAVDGLDPTQLGFLLDWRLAPLETDADVLRDVVRGTNEIGCRFVRHAVLVKSPLGALQAKRLQRAHDSEPEIFTDEAEAHAYVTAR